MGPSAARHRPYRDVGTTTVPAAPGVVWAATLDQVEVLGSPRYARFLGCRETTASGPRPLGAGSRVPGFRVVAARPPALLRLDGAHRFSAYTLTLRIAPDGARTRLDARTEATFPGVRGAVYRLVVMGSGLHRIATRSIVARIRRRALRAAGAPPGSAADGPGPRGR